MRKSIISIILLSVFSAIAVFGNAVIVDFRGTPNKNKVVLQWATISEVNCKEFEIERSLNNSDFNKIGTVKATGNSTSRVEYSYEDKTIFKTSTITRTFYYRIKIVDMDGKYRIHSQVISITPSISGARYTWGSIKALFR